MSIYIYRNPTTGKSEWIKRIGGIEKNEVDEDNLEHYSTIYASNHEPLLCDKFDTVIEARLLKDGNGFKTVYDIKHDNSKM